MSKHNTSPKVMTVFGTRPEAIKLAPVIQELDRREINQVVCVTGQHREMLDQMLSIFNISPDHDLNIMARGQSLSHIVSKSLTGLDSVIEDEKPDLIVVQGDTTTTFAAALAGFFHKIPVAHIEAGLRTNNKYSPFPEEINRRMVTQIADLHFAPTDTAATNLAKSGVQNNDIYITGNTVIDAVLQVSNLLAPVENTELKKLISDDKQFVLVTTHRRENLGDGMESIFTAIKRLAIDFPQTTYLFPVHLNPAIREHAEKVFNGVSNVILTQPFSYTDMAISLKTTYMVLTDSGGIQEEAPAFGKPVLVLRDTTERQEGVDAGTAILTGTDEQAIYRSAHKLLSDANAYREMSHATNPYGDGTAARQIVDALKNYFDRD